MDFVIQQILEINLPWQLNSDPLKNTWYTNMPMTYIIGPQSPPVVTLVEFRFFLRRHMMYAFN